MTDILERLHNRVHDAHMDHEILMDDALAEIERLQAALKEIAAMENEHDEWDGADRFRSARDFARQALTSGQTK